MRISYDFELTLELVDDTAPDVAAPVCFASLSRRLVVVGIVGLTGKDGKAMFA